MDKKIFALVFGVFLLGLVSASGACVPETYDSGWKNFDSHVVSSSGAGGAWPGDVYIDNGNGVIVVETPSLPFAESYDFTYEYKIGSAWDLDTEDYKVECGGNTYTFLDDVLVSDEKWRTKTITCDLNSGVNEIKFSSLNSGSVHFDKFKLEGEKICPVEEPVCGNDVLETGEQCDDGNNANGDGCSSQCVEEDEKRGKSTLSYASCEPNWECSGWSECSGGVMSRTCEDVQFCGLDFEYNRPIERAGCSVVEEVKVEENSINSLWFLVGVIVFILLIIVLVNLLI